jgi:hypothetical protein
MASDVIDFVLQMLVDRDILQSIPSWELLKDNLARECMMAPDRLEARKVEILGKFQRCKREHFDRKREEMEKAFEDLMGTTSTKTTSGLADGASPNLAKPKSTRSDQRPGQNAYVELEIEEEPDEPIGHPPVNEKLRVSRTRIPTDT